MALTNIRKQNIGEEVYRQCMNAIESGEWAPEERIPSENELAAKLGVSRVTVRGALQRLEGLKLIERRQGEGTFVCEPSGTSYVANLVPVVALGSHGLRDLMEFREIFDCEVASLAAQRGDAALVSALRKNYEKHMACRDNYAKAANYDTQFHFLLARASDNALIVQIYETFKPVFERNMIEIVSRMGTGDASKYHAQIIEAVERHDAREARRIMREHIHGTTQYVEEHFLPRTEDTREETK